MDLSDILGSLQCVLKVKDDLYHALEDHDQASDEN